MATAIQALERAPFRFHGVRARVFPLRADEAALQSICDRYLNLCPEEVAFRPVAPYVLLGWLHYSRMSYGGHRGWVSQQEVCFTVPVAWGRVEHGRWRALGSAVVTPFLFVDQPLSLELGREIYGWPKLPAEIRQGVDSHATAGWGQVATLTVESFARPPHGPLARGSHAEASGNAGGEARSRHRPLIEVERMQMDGAGSSLLGLGRALGPPWKGPMVLWREIARLAASGHRDAVDALPWLRQMLGTWSHGRLPAYYTANLKQVRSLEDAAMAAYQAITMAPLEMTALHRAGMLGERRIALGDSTAGYRIHVHRDPRFPILETLGLVGSPAPHGDSARAGYDGARGVRDEARAGHDRARAVRDDALAPDTTTLTPLFPFWLDADFAYGRDAAVLWRSPHRGDNAWHRRTSTGGVASSETVASTDDRAVPRFDASWGATMTPARSTHHRQRGPTDRRGSTLHAPSEANAGDSQLAVRVLALPATQHLAVTIAAWRMPLEAGQLRLLDAARPCVLMVVTGRPREDDEASRHVSFLVPVIWTRAGVETVAFAAARAFADGPRATMVAHEIGPEVTTATIDLPRGTDHAAPWLSLSNGALPAHDRDAEVEQCVLLEVTAHDRGLVEVPRPLSTSGEGDMRFCIIGRRRIRDAAAPEAFAYEEWFSQNLVMRGRLPVWQRGSALAVQIHPSPETLDLVGQLALAKQLDHRTVTVTPSAFAAATLAIAHESTTSLAVRIDGGPWTAPHPCVPRSDDRLAHWLAARDGVTP